MTDLNLWVALQESHTAGDEEDRSDWNFPRMNSRPADDRASFYSVGSRTASGSFANNVGMLSRGNDFARQYQG